ncbi:class I SAM-dependent methyltransferase [Mycobacterium sp. IS-3022]|uniref:SAM-dependent methyltransferase n=1 Tax=Mycobacterium sp. IS-3022 TaxID=1772277 RepID=UPI0007415099|nr:class I SAM-dependent methyltransferase [Mycobacterium sp. IS-3022]KUH97229.1 methyltransferase [Mycobacterium sp. IS-3022]KUH97455.1 methyltransferase [Mycobacterium sp. IS-3022]
MHVGPLADGKQHVTTIPRNTRDESLGARLGRWADEWRQMAAVSLSSSGGPKAGQIYDIVGTQNLYGEESLFINFGYWKNGPATLDEASRDLARLLARDANFNPSDTIVDCGCGYGDQDMLWINEFGPEHITGVNVAAEQVAIATRRVAEAGLADRIGYVNASATDLPFEDESSTKVVALESAFHFPSRVDFFAEALRVLQPGGLLVTADIVPTRTPLTAPARREVARRGWRGAPRWAVAAAADLAGYCDLLQCMGFVDVQTRPITDDVYAPLGRFLTKRLRDADMRHVNPVVRYSFTPLGFRLSAHFSDYIVAVAAKA